MVVIKCAKLDDNLNLLDFMKKKEHLLLCANTAWSLYNFRYGLISNFLERGFSVTILAPKDDYSPMLSNMGCDVFHLPMSAKGMNPIADLALLIRMIKIYRKLSPDFIIHYTIKPNIYGSVASKFVGIPSLAITTGLGYTFLNENIISKIARYLYKMAFGFPAEVWFLNSDDRQAFLLHNLVDEKKAVILHSEGINTSYFIPLPKPNYDDKFRFLLIARMLWDKGVGEYVESARLLKSRYPNVVFQLLGATDVLNPSVIDREQIAQWELDKDIEYLGTTSDVRSIISQADCVVLPSYREGVPRTLMEAAAMGKPLITTDTVGCRDVVINGRTGFLCPIKDASALADCMLQMLDMSNAERQAMGDAGRRLMIDKFDEQKTITQYLQTLTKYGIELSN